MPTLERLREMEKGLHVASVDARIMGGYFFTMTAIGLINREIHSESLQNIWNVGMVAFGISILRYLVASSKTDGYLEELSRDNE